MRRTKIIDAIKKSHRILVTSHMNPDLDALCSQLAVGLWCKQLGKKVSFINHSETPSRFFFVPGVKQVKKYTETMKKHFDLAIILDCGEVKRIGKVKDLIQDQTTVINIDHHVSNDNFGDINWIESFRSSTSEMIYVLLKSARVKLTKTLAKNLYIGILTDTGSFRYSNTSAETHKIIAELMQFNLSIDKIYRQIYESIPFNDFSAFAKILGKYKTLQENKVIYFEFDRKTQNQFSKDFDLREATLNFLRLSQGIELVIIFSIIDSRRTRVNFRSTDKINVARLAERFNGGGHKRASGCLVDLPMSAAKKKVISVVNELFK